MSLMLRPLARYADFKGRARRSEYWLFILFQVLAYIVGFALSLALTASGQIGLMIMGGLMALALPLIISLGLFIPNLAVTVRRLHDIGLSAWFLLLQLPSLIYAAMFGGSFGALARHMGQGGDPATLLDSLAPMVGPMAVMGLLGAAGNLVMFVMMLWPGTKGTNRFGGDPKNGGIDISVFDDERSVASTARIDDAIARAKAESDSARPPHKPIFDFGPGSTGPMINTYGRDAATETTAKPAPQPWQAPAYDPGVRPSKPFGKRG